VERAHHRRGHVHQLRRGRLGRHRGRFRGGSRRCARSGRRTRRLGLRHGGQGIHGGSRVAPHRRGGRLRNADPGPPARDLQRVDSALVDRRDQPPQEIEVHDLLAVVPLLTHLPARCAVARVPPHRFARSIYLSSRRSTRITSPSSRKRGTWTTAPVSSRAGFVPPVAVSPRTPGSVSTTLSSTKYGSSTEIMLSPCRSPSHSMFSFR